MRRRVLPLAGLLAALLILSGCVTMEVESEFNEDGSATHSMELTLDRSSLEQFGGEEMETDPFEDFEQMEREAEEQGFRAERIEDGDIIGVRLIQDVEDSSDLGTILNNLINAGSEGDEVVEPFSGTFEQDGDDYRLNLTVDGNALTNTAGEGLGEGEDGEDLSELGFDMSMIFDFSYAARMPGEIDEEATNGRIGDDGLVTWEIPLEGNATFIAESSDGGGSSNLVLILIVIGLVVLGLIALAAVAFFVLMNRRRTEPAVPGAAPAPPPPAYPATETDQTATGYTPPPPAPRVDPNQPTERITPPDEDPDDQLPARRDDEPRAF